MEQAVNLTEERFSRIVRNLATSEIVRMANAETGTKQKKLIALATEVFNGRYSFNYRPYNVTPGIGRNLSQEPLVELVVDPDCPDADNVINKFKDVLPITYLN